MKQHFDDDADGGDVPGCPGEEEARRRRGPLTFSVLCVPRLIFHCLLTFILGRLFGGFSKE